jgi:hypothetical protein
MATTAATKWTNSKLAVFVLRGGAVVVLGVVISCVILVYVYILDLVFRAAQRDVFDEFLHWVSSFVSFPH